MEHGFYDLAAMGARQARVVPFTRPGDPHGCAVVELLPGQGLDTPPGYRTDVFVLDGAVAGGAGGALSEGGFLSLHDDIGLAGGPDGAVLLVYREPAPAIRPPVRSSQDERPWRAGRIAGMGIADLALGGYQLALVRWETGTQVPDHSHGDGEELFVLSGKLQVNDAILPAGSWLRLGPGERHRSGAAEPTLILLRSGHLGSVH